MERLVPDSEDLSKTETPSQDLGFIVSQKIEADETEEQTETQDKKKDGNLGTEKKIDDTALLLEFSEVAFSLSQNNDGPGEHLKPDGHCDFVSQTDNPAPSLGWSLPPPLSMSLGSLGIGETASVQRDTCNGTITSLSKMFPSQSQNDSQQIFKFDQWPNPNGEGRTGFTPENSLGRGKRHSYRLSAESMTTGTGRTLGPKKNWGSILSNKSTLPQSKKSRRAQKPDGDEEEYSELGVDLTERLDEGPRKGKRKAAIEACSNVIHTLAEAAAACGDIVAGDDGTGAVSERASRLPRTAHKKTRRYGEDEEEEGEEEGPAMRGRSESLGEVKKELIDDTDSAPNSAKKRRGVLGNKKRQSPGPTVKKEKKPAAGARKSEGVKEEDEEPEMVEVKKKTPKAPPRVFPDGTPSHVRNWSETSELQPASEEELLVFLETLKTGPRELGEESMSFSVLPPDTAALEKAISENKNVEYIQVVMPPGAEGQCRVGIITPNEKKIEIEDTSVAPNPSASSTYIPPVPGKRTQLQERLRQITVDIFESKDNVRTSVIGGTLRIFPASGYVRFNGAGALSPGVSKILLQALNPNASPASLQLAETSSKQVSKTVTLRSAFAANDTIIDVLLLDKQVNQELLRGYESEIILYHDVTLNVDYRACTSIKSMKYHKTNYSFLMDTIVGSIMIHKNAIQLVGLKPGQEEQRLGILTNIIRHFPEILKKRTTPLEAAVKRKTLGISRRSKISQSPFLFSKSGASAASASASNHFTSESASSLVLKKEDKDSEMKESDEYS